MILALYVGGFMEQLFMESAVRLAPIDTIRHGISGEDREKKLTMNVILKFPAKELTAPQDLWMKRNVHWFYNPRKVLKK